MKISEIITAYGHKNIQATHETTLEISKANNLSERGTCIVAVSADKALTDLSAQFKHNLRKENANLTILIAAGKLAEKVNAMGSSLLVLDHPTDMVIRNSSYICARTLAIQADKAAGDLPRNFVERLKESTQRLKITLTVRT